ncbi:hypothetical protein ACFL0Z_00015 [Patescibacteria group bacterium]
MATQYSDIKFLPGSSLSVVGTGTLESTVTEGKPKLEIPYEYELIDIVTHTSTEADKTVTMFIFGKPSPK